MPKCIICEEPAAFAIKGRPETYCRECALDSFSDLELLQRLDRGRQEAMKSQSRALTICKSGPLVEQRTIAIYLDAETSRIDDLINKKNELT